MTQNDSQSPTTSARTRGLEGLVAQILNERELVINIGRKAGVTKGTVFAVLAEVALEVKDPVSGESLGTVDREKIRVRATEVQERMTICRTFEEIVYGGLGLSAQVYDMFSTPRREVETFRAPKNEIPAPLSQDESIVKVKDRVREIAIYHE